MAGCAAGGLLSLDDLKKLPEAGLHPPESSFVGHTNYPQTNTIEGPVPAMVGDIFGAEMTADEVFAWYANELPARGWTLDPSDGANIRTTTEQAARAWRKGDVVARVAVYKVGDIQNPVPGSFATGFEIALIAKAPDPSLHPMP